VSYLFDQPVPERSAGSLGRLVECSGNNLKPRPGTVANYIGEQFQTQAVGKMEVVEKDDGWRGSSDPLIDLGEGLEDSPLVGSPSQSLGRKCLTGKNDTCLVLNKFG
jgi:hypothetical protein